MNHKPFKIPWPIIYILIAAVFITIASILINTVKGKHFDWKAKTWKENGMIIFASRPSRGNIFVNDKLIKYKTGSNLLQTKLDIFEPGEYQIKVEKNGYLPWNKKMLVKPGMVTWANYIWLFLEKPAIEIITTGQHVQRIFQSNDQNKLILETNENNINRYYLFDTIENKQIEINFDTETLKNIKINNIYWSEKDSKIIMEAFNLEEKIYIVLSGKDFGEITNINELFKLRFDNIVWSNSSENELIGLQKGNLHRISLSDKSISAVLAQGVSNFKVINKNRIQYISTGSNNSEISLWQIDASGNNKQKIIASLPQSNLYDIKYSKDFESIAILAVDPKILMTVFSMNNKLTTQQISNEATFVEWSPDNKRLMFGNQKNAWVYDIDKKIEYQLFNGEIVMAKWYLDSCHIIIKTKDNNVILEFDGTNMVNLAQNAKSILYYINDFNTFFFLDQNNNLSKMLVSK